MGEGLSGLRLNPDQIPRCRLRPLDVAFLRAVHEKVNIIPVIAKADALMPKETQALKQRVGLVTSDLWPYMKPKVAIKPELSFDFVDLGLAFWKHDVSG